MDSYSGDNCEKVRQWLADNYVDLGIKYVLILCDYGPNGDNPLIPMVFADPFPDDDPYYPLGSYTDLYYADLDNSWTYNDDGVIVGASDPAFYPEAFVGRIVYYDSDTTMAAGELQRIISYETDTSDTSWRWNGILAGAIMNYIWRSFQMAPGMI